MGSVDEPSSYAMSLMSKIEGMEEFSLQERDIIDLTSYERRALDRAAQKRGYTCIHSWSEQLLTFLPRKGRSAWAA